MKIRNPQKHSKQRSDTLKVFFRKLNLLTMCETDRRMEKSEGPRTVRMSF